MQASLEKGLQLHFPPSMGPHIKSVLEGEYDVPCKMVDPVILDIGANIGSFSLWAALRWPDSRIFAYEPLPDNFKLLQENVELFKDRITTFNVAVGNPWKRRLFTGKHNCGEASFYDLGEQSGEYVEVESIAPHYLQENADILKLDVEGSEVDILEGLTDRRFEFIVLEYHSDKLRRQIDFLLGNYALIGCHSNNEHRGILKYRHK